MDLREKLRSFESDFRIGERETVRRTNRDIDCFVEGEEVSNGYGRFFRSVTLYPEGQHHGDVPLSLLAETEPAVFGLVGKDESLRGVDLRKAIFLDTETTGLAGGVGTVAFLVGLGYFEGDSFRVEQLFMRDFHEEQAVLEAVRERLVGAEALVSYNGKGYDLNLLAARFTLARMANPALDLPHLDLLFTARRLWHRKLRDCSLTNVERCVLGFYRDGDVPSYLIPSLYFDYIRSHRGELLEPVFEHNRWDILSLVALAAWAGKIYEEPHVYLDHPLDLLSLGRALEGMARMEEAAVCYRMALNHPMESQDREEVLRLLGFSLKRLGDWEKAIQVWEQMVESVPHRIFPYEELAKYYEHRVGSFNRAIGIVNRVLERIRIVEELRPELRMGSDREDLEYRLARLKRKLGRAKKGSCQNPSLDS